MFKSRSETNICYKCSVRLFDDTLLELEFQVNLKFVLEFNFFVNSLWKVEENLI